MCCRMSGRTLKKVDFNLGGKPFHALAAGTPGRPLLLFLHGFPEYSGAWEEVLPLLADRWYCVAPDQRGYGRSWRPEGIENYRVSALVADAAAMIARFAPEGRAAAVIGHDWGASVAYALAIRLPELIDRLVILNGVHPAVFQQVLAEGGAQTAASQYITWLRAERSEEVLAADGYARLLSLFGGDMDLGWLTPKRRADYEKAWGGAAGLRAMIDWYRASRIVVPEPGADTGRRRDPQLRPRHVAHHHAASAALGAAGHRLRPRGPDPAGGLLRRPERAGNRRHRPLAGPSAARGGGCGDPGVPGRCLAQRREAGS